MKKLIKRINETGWNKYTRFDYKPVDKAIAEGLYNKAQNKEKNQVFTLNKKQYALIFKNERSFYFLSKKGIIRVSDHWSVSNHKNYNFNCRNIGVCRWTLMNLEDRHLFTGNGEMAGGFISTEEIFEAERKKFELKTDWNIDQKLCTFSSILQFHKERLITKITNSNKKNKETIIKNIDNRLEKIDALTNYIYHTATGVRH